MQGISILRLTHHRNVSDQSLSNDASQKLELHDGAVLPFWRETVVENVQPIGIVPRAAVGVLDRIQNIGMHLQPSQPGALNATNHGSNLVDYFIDLFIKEELPNMDQFI